MVVKQLLYYKHLRGHYTSCKDNLKTKCCIVLPYNLTPHSVLGNVCCTLRTYTFVSHLAYNMRHQWWLQIRGALATQLDSWHILQRVEEIYGPSSTSKVYKHILFTCPLYRWSLISINRSVDRSFMSPIDQLNIYQLVHGLKCVATLMQVTVLSIFTDPVKMKHMNKPERRPRSHMRSMIFPSPGLYH